MSGSFMNGKHMYQYQTTYWPQSQPYFAAFRRSAAPRGATTDKAARTDSQIERDVKDELAMEPTVYGSAIGVAVKDGVATLTGTVDGDGERWLIEAAARRIAGVRSLSVHLNTFVPGIVPADEDIALDCERVLGGLMPRGDYAIQVMVSHGRVTMVGNVAEGYERRIAEVEISSLLSVLGVNSQVQVRPFAP